MAAAAAVLVAVFGPSVARRGIENYRTLKERRPVFAGPIETQIYPWLQLQARRMTEATQPYEWRAVSFRHGPCHPDNTVQLPNAVFRAAVIEACAGLDDIQTRYVGACFAIDECVIPEAALEEIGGVAARLDEVFGEAGLVEPYTRPGEENP